MLIGQVLCMEIILNCLIRSKLNIFTEKSYDRYNEELKMSPTLLKRINVRFFSIN